MNKIKIGILCPSEIAYRRFLPALMQCDNFEYAGVAIASQDEWEGKPENDEYIKSELFKAQKFKDDFGGVIFKSYKEMTECDDIDAIYVPLPPALHYKWGKVVLKNNKHLLMEKPFTVSEEESTELIEIAKKNNLAVHENYMFLYHSQLEFISRNISRIGEIRGIRTAFTFPMRSANDFRYKKELGGGALLDCGGYPVRLVSELLGDNIKIDTSRLQYIRGYEVDFYGNATLSDDNVTAQIIFGMDNSYKCELEIQGSLGCIYTDRIFTAPDGFKPTVKISIGNEVENTVLEPDNSFKKSINRFLESINNIKLRKQMFDGIIKQARLIDSIKE